ncbi:MAG: 2-C-methyl-D-erythritol 4-phosphate cytidylyltransferase [Candidatus Delongbacteria bacterium]|jgi:2-C-methyl-D-erythritol 4-phosphate cytidylyltransferase|nr:2-C-methyl-D-erythritol 4-phosphate cytidylyltransferase [Candidatus Delongbacteria bacterium]
MAKVIALITAGGSGSRMGAEIKKQYLEINNKPILAHTIHRFQITEKVDEIVLTLPEEDIPSVKKNIIERYNFSKLKLICSGGSTRQDSVLNALNSISAEEDDLILIHDGVRPFISHEMILNCIGSLEGSDGSVTAIKPVNTIKELSGQNISFTLDRDKLISVQTPQTFRIGLIKKCHEEAKADNFYATDDSALLEKYGEKILGRAPVIKVVEGSSFNIKITDKNDLILASAIFDSLSI